MTHSNIFQVNNNKSTAITVDECGNTLIDSLILLDGDGSRWKIRVKDGQLVIEPLDVINKRNEYIKSILNEKTSD